MRCVRVSQVWVSQGRARVSQVRVSQFWVGQV